MAKSQEAKKPEVSVSVKEQILENLLESLLDEVSIRNGMRQISAHQCAGCKGQTKPLRACVAARDYLTKLREEREAAA